MYWVRHQNWTWWGKKHSFFKCVLFLRSETGPFLDFELEASDTVHRLRPKRKPAHDQYSEERRKRSQANANKDSGRWSSLCLFCLQVRRRSRIIYLSHQKVRCQGKNYWDSLQKRFLFYYWLPEALWKSKKGSLQRRGCSKISNFLWRFSPWLDSDRPYIWRPVIQI